MITMERACCLYALLTETPIDYGSLVTTMMISVRLTDKDIALLYGALITQIAEHVKVPLVDLRELQPKRRPIGVCLLDVSNAHLWEAEQEKRPQRPLRAA
jgi:hypothetical protein